MHTIIETWNYLTHAKHAGMSDGERQGVVDTLASDPEIGELIVGTAGARKVRFAKEGGGKSGGYRVITFYAADDVPLFLLDVFAKGDKVNLTKAERNELAGVLSGLSDAYRESTKATATKLKRKGVRL